MYQGKFGFGVLALIALILVMPQLHALEAYNDTERFATIWLSPTVRTGGWGWELAAMLAVSICFFATALIYMFGHAFSMENIKRYANSEMLQVVASAVLISTAVFILQGALNYTVQYVVGEDSIAVCKGQEFAIFDYSAGPISFAACKIEESIDLLENCYQQTYQNNLGVERQASTCVNIKGIPVYCGDWFLHSEVEQSHLIGYKIVPLLTNLYGQRSMMDYLAENMLAVFLPVGLILRVFPPLRGIGGLLIATAIGFYFVYPTIYLINDPTFVKKTRTEDTSYVDPIPACYPGFKGSAAVLSIPPLPGGRGPIAPKCPDAASLITKVTINLTLYPFVALVATLIFIRVAAPILGGDTGEILRMTSKLI
ncbi:hypothetical protein FJZ26_05295 [Candidatus Parvarchaeota archaeon]|nr:hypothetical protein [Candidatus Parvarchaeota archaeon]